MTSGSIRASAITTRLPRIGTSSERNRRRCSSPFAQVPSLRTTRHHGSSAVVRESARPAWRGAPGHRSP